MKILISNDDGIHAEGIAALISALSSEHELYVAAPSGQRSAFSHSVTYFRQTNRAERVMLEGAAEAWAVDGTPADCVFYAMCGLFGDVKFDLVIAGINDGRNLTTDIIYSGTVGAAGEGMLCRVPSMAVSLCGRPPVHYETAALAAKKLIPVFMKDPARLSYILNVNVPDLPAQEIRGFRKAVMDLPVDYRRPLKIQKEDEDTLLISIESKVPDLNENLMMPEGDVTAVKNGYIALSPLMYDMVRYGVMQKLSEMEKISLV